MPDANGVASDDELLAALRSAGLSGDSLAKAAATVRAEGGRAGARNYAGNHPESSVDRGFGQFNSFWHPEVSDACADDLGCAATQIARISKGGTDFSPWVATTTDRYTGLLTKYRDLTGATKTGAGFIPTFTLPTLPTPTKGAETSAKQGSDRATDSGGNLVNVTAGNVATSGDGIGGAIAAAGDNIGRGISGGLAPIGKVFDDVRTGFVMTAWRAGFVIAGLVLIGAGVRMFLADEHESHEDGGGGRKPAPDARMAAA